jgi:formylglycine-generating enzyme required for sulfatase activity
MFKAPEPNPELLGKALDARWAKQIVIVADSVVLGARDSIVKGLPDWRITFRGRPALMIDSAAQDLRRQRPSLPPVAVVALGYNTLWEKNRLNYQFWSDKFDAAAENMLAVLESLGVQKVVWVMLRELTPELLPAGSGSLDQYHRYAWYFPYVNERLRALKVRHPDLALADWVTPAKQKGITYDAIHVNADGAELMLEVLKIAIGIGVVQPAPAPSSEPAAASAANSAASPPAAVPAAQPQEIRQITLGVGAMFRDCPLCPEMVVVPEGGFRMGASDGDPDQRPDELPAHAVKFASPFAVGRTEVTFAEWEACVSDGGCQSNSEPDDEGWGRGRHPVINVSWNDAQGYAAWLTRKTGKAYRLLTEAEWEYVARAGGMTPFYFGAKLGPEQANINPGDSQDGKPGNYRERTLPVGETPANAWGLYDTHGNVGEWVLDAWHEDYASAPGDGSAWMEGGDAELRVIRGGSWYKPAQDCRVSSRARDLPDHRSADIGFRLARLP